MTIIGGGGVTIVAIERLVTFTKDYKKLTVELQSLTKSKIKDLLKNPRPPGIRFEKLKGYRKPNIYTIHVTGNYKISFEIKGSTAILRRIGTHNLIDRKP